MFVLGALLLSVFLAAVAYSFTRSSLLNQRERTSTSSRPTATPSVAQNELQRRQRRRANAIVDRLQQLGVSAGRAQHRRRVDVASDAKFTAGRRSRRRCATGWSTTASPARMIISRRRRADAGRRHPAGVERRLRTSSSSDLGDVSATLRSVGLSLLFGGMITTLAGVLLGVVAARRAVRPLGDAAQAAKAIAGGRLDTRLETTDDPDLQLLTDAFNDMAEALQNRVERDARFASDVSHELRSPLMTLAASVEVMQARRDEMPERAQAALDLLVGDVARFQGLVEDLLEISRFDAGAIRLHLEDLLVAEFVRQAVAVSSLPKTQRDRQRPRRGDRSSTATGAAWPASSPT